MQLFLDTADINVIKAWAETGLVDGVTTNPSLLAKTEHGFDIIPEIASIVNGPVSVEVIANTREDMILEGKHLAKLSSHVVIKLPLTFDGLFACRTLVAEGIQTNVTLCFSTAQALLAAKAGATYVSPFIGRLDDKNEDGLSLIEHIRHVFDMHELTTCILSASIRTVQHVIRCAYLGSDSITIPPHILKEMIYHPLTDSGLKKFQDDWKNAKLKGVFG